MKKKLLVIPKFISRFITALLNFIFPCTFVLSIPNGWDTIYIFAPYSFGGVPRKEFMQLCRKSKKCRISNDEYYRAKYKTVPPTNADCVRNSIDVDCVKDWIETSFFKLTFLPHSY